MRILDESSDKKLDNISLFFTEEEASEMRDSLELLLFKKSGHHHINNESFDKEITVCLYDKKKLNGFHERAKKLILEDQ